MRNIIDIYESILTKTSTRLKTVSGEINKVIETWEMAKTIDEIFCDVVDTLESIDQKKLIEYFSKNAKRVTPKTDYFGQELNLGDVVAYNWQSGRGVFPWYGFVVKTDYNGNDYECEIMESGFIYPDEKDPFYDSCTLHQKKCDVIKICGYKDALKTVNKLKKTIK